MGDAHDAADVAVFQAHLVEDEERLRAGDRCSGIEGFSQLSAFLSEAFCTCELRSKILPLEIVQDSLGSLLAYSYL